MDITDSGDEEDAMMMEDEIVCEDSAIVSNFAWPDDRPHPLLIPWVIQQMFDYLPLKLVEKQRHVCSLWAEEATKIIKKKKIMVFYDEEVIRHYNDVMRTTNSYPHTAFEFHTCNLSCSKPLSEFWQLFGWNIKRLEFHQSTIDGQALYKILSTEAPNLECLVLRNPPKSFPHSENASFPYLKEIIFQYFPYSDQESRLCLKNLFAVASNLEKIRFLSPTTQERVANRMMNIVVDVLTDTEASISLPRLSEIDIRLDCENSHITRLATKRFPLTKLEVTVTFNAKSKDFREYLNTISESLKKLSVTFPYGNTQFQNCFVPPSVKTPGVLYDRFLINLTHLSLKNYAGSLNFVMKLPNLISLNLRNANLAEILPSGLCIGQHQLSIFKADTVADCRTIYRIANCFPTLKVLHVGGVNDDSLRTIYRELPFLVELDLKKGSFTDTGISGVSSEICLDMAETTTYIGANPAKLRLDLYIGSLPNLSILKLDSSLITDLSVILGIVSCPKLQSLTLKSEDITDTGMRIIGHKMNKTLVFLDVSQCLGVSEAGKFYVKEKLKGRQVISEVQRAVPPSTQPLPNRFIVTGGGNRDVLPALRPHFSLERRHSFEERTFGRFGWPHHRQPVLQGEAEMLHHQRDRILALHEHIQEEAANLLDNEPILDADILEPEIQRELLAAAHDVAALELNAGALPLIPVPPMNRQPHGDPPLDVVMQNVLGFGFDYPGLEAQFIERRRHIFVNMVRERRNLNNAEGEALPLPEQDDLFWEL